MCGRFTLRTPPHLLAKQFQLDDVPGLTPRYNIAPTQDVAVVRINPGTEKRALSLLRWGLIPFWAEDPKIGYSTINARSETVATKPSFREAGHAWLPTCAAPA
jgi:putative SOS response-associated peptidase YedK